MKKKRNYYRTTALLGAQPQRSVTVTKRRQAPPLRVSWKIVLPVVLVATVLLWLWLDGRWYVSEGTLRVSGVSTSAQVNDIARASDLLTWHGLFVHPESAADKIIEALPGVIEAKVECRRFPADCTIYVVERTPVMLWVTDSMVYGMDCDGVLFPTQVEYAGVPAIRAVLPDRDDQGALLAAWEGVKTLADLGVLSDSLVYHEDRGLVWTDPEGRRVAFGTGSDMQARWEIYGALVDSLDARTIFPWVIDVRFPAGPTYALQKSW